MEQSFPLKSLLNPLKSTWNKKKQQALSDVIQTYPVIVSFLIGYQSVF